MQEKLQYNIMVVDDDRQVLRITSELLRLEGYSVIECNDPLAAIDLLKSKPCDVVLSDIKMPGITGIDLMRAVHKMDKDVPIVLFTAYVDVDIAVSAIKEAAFDFIIKPYAPDVLIRAIERALQARDYKRLQEEYQNRLEREVEEKTKTLDSMIEELKRARDRAEESSRLKSEILSNMSHEIRTPLNGIIGMTEVILSQDIDKELRGYVELIRKSGWSLNNILANVIEVSALDAGTSALVVAKVEIASILKELTNEFMSLAKEKGIELSTKIKGEVPDIFIGDPYRLKQVLFQLIDNALKFTDKGEVEVQVDLKERHPDRIELLFRIFDTGIGIAQEKLPYIFESFRQADGSMTRRHGGLGLGLAIVHRIVDLMGGEVKVESQLGKGTVFYVSIPFKTIG